MDRGIGVRELPTFGPVSRYSADRRTFEQSFIVVRFEANRFKFSNADDRQQLIDHYRAYILHDTRQPIIILPVSQAFVIKIYLAVGRGYGKYGREVSMAEEVIRDYNGCYMISEMRVEQLHG